MMDKEIAKALGSTPDKIAKSWKERKLQESEMAKAFQWLLDNGGPDQAEPPQPTLPNATDFAKILGAVAPIASASLGNEAVLQALGGHFRAMVELCLQHPDYSIERILGSLDERLRGLDDQTSRPE